MLKYICPIITDFPHQIVPILASSPSHFSATQPLAIIRFFQSAFNIFKAVGSDYFHSSYFTSSWVAQLKFVPSLQCLSPLATGVVPHSIQDRANHFEGINNKTTQLPGRSHLTAGTASITEIARC